MIDFLAPQRDVTALILAGGVGRRMGGADKGLMLLHGKPLVEHVIDAIKPQVAGIIISANRNLDAYRRYGYPVIQDRLPDNPGPLAGIAQGLKTAETSFVLTLPCDAPRVASDLALRMRRAVDSQKLQVAIAHDGDRLQPAHLLLSRELLSNLEAELAGGMRKVRAWAQTLPNILVDFSDQKTCFGNINSPPDLEEFECPSDNEAAS